MEIYKEVIIQAVIIFPVVAALFTMPYMLYNYHKYGSVLSMRILIVYSFILYLLVRISSLFCRSLPWKR